MSDSPGNPYDPASEGESGNEWVDQPPALPEHPPTYPPVDPGQEVAPPSDPAVPPPFNPPAASPPSPYVPPPPGGHGGPGVPPPPPGGFGAPGGYGGPGVPPPPGNYGGPGVPPPPGGYGAPGYPQPGQMYAPVSAPPQQNNQAVASLILGICSLVGMFCCALISVPLAIAALVTGKKGLDKANLGASGRGLAIAGLVTGGIGLAFSLVGLVIFMVALLSGSGSSY